MPLRLPQNLPTRFSIETGAGILERELLAEKAATLGRIGRETERELKRLRDHDAGHGDGAARDALVRSAADAVWRFIIQRELCGFREPDAIASDYAIPREVMNRVGAGE